MPAQLSPTQRAAQLLARHPLFLDTETTGLDGEAEICDLAVIDHTGHVLLNTLVRPTRHIPPDATAIHGITDADVAGAPTFAEVGPRLAELLYSRFVIIYNADFDVRMLRQSHRAAGLPRDDRPLTVDCLMELYAEHHGDWVPRRGSYRWQSLGSAALQCGLSWPDGGAHRAATDAEMARRLLVHLAHLGK